MYLLNFHGYTVRKLKMNASMTGFNVTIQTARIRLRKQGLRKTASLTERERYHEKGAITQPETLNCEAI